MTPYKKRVLQALDQTSAVVPMLWNLEMASILRKFAKQNGAGLAELEGHLSNLASLPIVIDEWEASKAALKKGSTLRSLTQAALTYDLTPYDSQYLQLALRESLPLASCDEELIERAKQLGVAIFKQDMQ